MADQIYVTPKTNWVAIDVAKEWNAVLIETNEGHRHRFKMLNNAADHDRLVAFLHGLSGNCRVALEPTGDYHRPLAYRLKTEGFEVLGISSVAEARYREAQFGTWDKNDPKDAQVILRMLKQGLIQVYHDPLLAGNHDLQDGMDAPLLKRHQMCQSGSVDSSTSITERSVHHEG
ncbi:MAG: IS110 family transposase [Sulfuricaulis sp.]